MTYDFVKYFTCNIASSVKGFKCQIHNSHIPSVVLHIGVSGRSLAVFSISTPCLSTQKQTEASHCTGK